MSQRLKIGVVGAGARGETFARQLHKGTEQAELFGICDIDEQRLGEFCDYCQLGDTHRSTEPDSFLASKELDAVIITTPEFTHADVAELALGNNKHVYLEKPLANSVENCYRILEAHKKSSATAYVGFNMRAAPSRQKLKQIVAEGTLGQIVNVSGVEQLAQAHGAAFMRRFHRHSKNSGGLLNHKCSHDLDIMLWTIGHEHRVRRISSFGGTHVFKGEKAPATNCSQCPEEIFHQCPYKMKGGFVFPIHAEPIIHNKRETYGGDLCVYSDDKDIVDNQTVLLEWDHGVSGTFVLTMFQNKGGRSLRVWGEKGFGNYDSVVNGEQVEVESSDYGDRQVFSFGDRQGGHGGTDPLMLRRFCDTIHGNGPADSGLAEGLAASLVAIKADEARLSGKMIELTDSDYEPV